MASAFLELILGIFIAFAAPLPWWLILFHLAVQRRSKFFRYAAYGSVAFVWAGLGYAVLQSEELLFAGRFQSPLAMRGLGIVFLLGAVMIDVAVIKSLGFRRLSCLSELRKNDQPGQLVTGGIFAYARHPRYIEYCFWFLGFGLLFGYESLLWFAVYLLVGFWVASYFEEAELVQRFGQSYIDYQKRVPRFFLRLKAP